MDKISYEGHEALVDAWARISPSSSEFVMLSFIGPKESVKAVRAQLLEGRYVDATIHGAPPEISIIGNGSGYKSVSWSFENLTHTIVFYNIGFAEGTYIIGKNDQELMERLYAAVEQHSDIPLHPDWMPVIWNWLTTHSCCKPLVTSPGLKGYDLRSLWSYRVLTELKSMLLEHYRLHKELA